jgi:hypothetical protein
MKVSVEREGSFERVFTELATYMTHFAKRSLSSFERPDSLELPMRRLLLILPSNNVFQLLL